MRKQIISATIIIVIAFFISLNAGQKVNSYVQGLVAEQVK